MNNMMVTSGMMKTPQDVIIKLESNPIIPVGKESQIKLLVLDKFTQTPMTGAQVVVGIERRCYDYYEYDGADVPGTRAGQ
jgi:hypothetical protein